MNLKTEKRGVALSQSESGTHVRLMERLNHMLLCENLLKLIYPMLMKLFAGKEYMCELT
jgi:hypothetical protein